MAAWRDRVRQFPVFLKVFIYCLLVEVSNLELWQLRREMDFTKYILSMHLDHMRLEKNKRHRIGFLVRLLVHKS